MPFLTALLQDQMIISQHILTDWSEQTGKSAHMKCFLVAAAVKAVCSEYKIHNADIHLKEDCDVDDLVDCIEGSRVYIPCIYVLNKIDQVKS